MTATIIVGWTASRLIPPVKLSFSRGIYERRSADRHIFRRAAFDQPKTDQFTRITDTTEDMRRQPSGSCSVRSFLDNLRPAFSVSHQFQDFQSGFFGPEWEGFDSFVEDICDCYRQKHGRKEAMTIATGACGSQLTRSLEERIDPVVECRPVTSAEYFIDVSGVRSRAPLRWTLLVSEEALDCVMENAPEGALQLDSLCIKASNRYLVALHIPGELAEVILLPRFSYTLSSDPTQMQRVPCKRKPLRFVQWPEDVDNCGLEEMLLDPVVPASNKRPVQEYRTVSSLEYYKDVFGVRPPVALRCTLLVSSEEALDCVMETDAEPVASVFQGALQLDSLCLKASNQHSVVLLIPGELAEAVLLPRFSYPLSSDPTQMQREPRKRRPLRFVLWPEDVDYCRSLLRSSGTELSAKEEQGAQNHRRNRRAIERAVHPLSGQMTRKIPETVAVAEPCFELPFFSDISREEPEHPHLLTE